MQDLQAIASMSSGTEAIGGKDWHSRMSERLFPSISGWPKYVN